MIKHNEIVSELKITIQGDMYGKVKYHILGRFNDEDNAPVSGLYDKKIDELLAANRLTTDHDNLDDNLKIIPIVLLNDLLLNGSFRFVEKGSEYRYTQEKLDKMKYKPKGTTKDGTIELIKSDTNYIVQRSKWIVSDANSLTLELSDKILEVFEKLKSHDD
ncbi:MAG: hypothetical protein A2W93_10045 [Bacteroidetes bacterium GWF2_43_63]|nr:MAG: hypothetical protein A2W94_02425 [Bacteroidetes bacterium GWE2_42_42]OFY52864.1 MAG: hypothetical protein A2W93_10045 [Bacteroidetes bacterium GWF2_43_63]HBG70069.1 hypothetical protein [Bacteroidales bacterium]HCB62324.1 hypothetical protein [Bacteroidales bacterium]